MKIEAVSGRQVVIGLVAVNLAVRINAHVTIAGMTSSLFPCTTAAASSSMAIPSTPDAQRRLALDLVDRAESSGARIVELVSNPQQM